MHSFAFLAPCIAPSILAPWLREEREIATAVQIKAEGSQCSRIMESLLTTRSSRALPLPDKHFAAKRHAALFCFTAAWRGWYSGSQPRNFKQDLERALFRLGVMVNRK